MNLCQAQTKFSAKYLKELISTEVAHSKVEEKFFDVIWIVKHYLLHFFRQLVLHHAFHRKGASCVEAVNTVKTVDHSFVSLILVIVATHQISLALSLLAGQCFVHNRVVNLLFPAVATRTEGLQGTSLVIISDESPSLPVLTEVTWIIVEEVGLTPEILPVMCVHAQSFVVLAVKKRAPLSLEVEHKEFLIARVFMNQSRFNVQLGVCEGAKLGVNAFISFTHAELSLVLLNMVESFNIAVS